jgi:predicted Zn finger-like uncharacterized protein
VRTIECSHCGTKYRVDPSKFSSQTPKIRCKKCSNVFQANLAPEPAESQATEPQAPASPPAAEETAPTAPTVATQSAPEPPRPATQSEPAQAPAGAIAALFAHESAEIREQVVAEAAKSGVSVTAVDNGVDALVGIQSKKYAAAVLDVSLPKMFGFEVCEVVRRETELDHIKLILIAAIYDQKRYRRPPSSLYGADGYIEKQRLVETFADTVRSVLDGSYDEIAAGGTGNILSKANAPTDETTAKPEEPQQDQGLTSSESQLPADSTTAEADRAQDDAPALMQEPQPQPQPTPEPEPTPPTAPAPAAPSAPSTAGAPAAESPSDDLPPGIEKKAMEKARRLGRVIVSDLVLYNKETFEQATSPQDIYDALAKDISDSREQIDIKVSQEIRDFEDVLDVAIRNYLAKQGK